MSHFEKNHAIKLSQAPLTRELKFGSAEKKETQLKKRLIDNSKATSHGDPLFLKYKILKINDLINFNHKICLKSLETLKDLLTINLTFSKCAHYSI